MELVGGGCTCGCGEMTVVTKAIEPCGCGCECCSEKAPKPKEIEVAELVALRASIENRLAELQGATPH
ncbi:MAG TPA: hypothetical protein VFO60_04180 [Candidatus Dormibacteraeota bacterium]|nr:hypothetical protein [Candidatus Dormibacteraeota bacterium]